MNRRQAITRACLLLRRQGKEESLARFLLMYMLDENAQQLTNNISEQISKEIEELYFSLIDKHIEENMPLSHLAGFEYFYDRKFKVTKDVLSPRMETEELIYKVIEYIKSINKNLANDSSFPCLLKRRQAFVIACLLFIIVLHLYLVLPSSQLVQQYEVLLEPHQVYLP